MTWCYYCATSHDLGSKCGAKLNKPMNYKPPHEYREKVQHTCCVCGVTFLAVKNKRYKDRYCSNSCSQRAKYRRSKQK